MKTIPLRIDSDLVNQAREAAATMERTPTAQIEFWAKLGRVLETAVTHESLVLVKQMGRVERIDEVMALTRTPKGRARALAAIAKSKGPLYGTDPDDGNVIIETASDGTKRRGRFVNRKFVAL